MYYYGAKKFNQISRNYRHLDGELYFGCFYHVQFVQVPTTSCTSCVRFYFQSSYFSQYSFYALKSTQKQMTKHIANTRQLFSQAPKLQLRHLMDMNLLTRLIHLLTNESTQLIHFLRTNDNKEMIDCKSNSNNNSNSNSNSSIIFFLYYSNIKRVFQTDGECIAIRLSTLIDGKKQKKLSAEEDSNPICCEEKEGTILLL